MYSGARVTDAVNYLKQRGELRVAVKVVRHREPEKLRWRNAVGAVNQVTGKLRGRERAVLEEPIREMVLDLGDTGLRREVILDARRLGVDLDRGEVLPHWVLGDLRRFVFLTGTDFGSIHRYAPLPSDFDAPIDTAAVVIVGRALADFHRKRAHRAWLSMPDPDGGAATRPEHVQLVQRADRDADLAARWAALARTMAGEA